MILVNKLLNYPKKPEELSCYLCTTNDVVKGNGELVMGAGNALAFKQAYPNAPAYFGCILGKGEGMPFMVAHHGDGLIGVFQVKRDWKEPANIDLLTASTDMLMEAAKRNPKWNINLPFPGIGKGGLTITEVMPIIERLPDNVHVFLAESFK